MKRGLVAVRPHRWRLPLAIAITICTLGAATLAFNWDSKTGTGSTEDAMRVTWQGNAKQRVQAIIESSNTAASIVRTLKNIATKGNDRERHEANMALERLRRLLSD